MPTHAYAQKHVPDDNKGAEARDGVRSGVRAFWQAASELRLGIEACDGARSDVCAVWQAASELRLGIEDLLSSDPAAVSNAPDRLLGFIPGLALEKDEIARAVLHYMALMTAKMKEVANGDASRLQTCQQFFENATTTFLHGVDTPLAAKDIKGVKAACRMAIAAHACQNSGMLVEGAAFTTEDQLLGEMLRREVFSLGVWDLFPMRSP